MTTKSLTQIGEAIFDETARSISFFNGRLLTADDLNTEKEANRRERLRLGSAIGDGIAYGLAVAPTPGADMTNAPAITVQPGLAINREGQVLFLKEAVDVGLVDQPVNDTTPPSISAFKTCDIPQPGIYVAGAGLYLLTVLPVEGTEGRAPVSGLGNFASPCNTKYIIGGVQFRLIPVDLEAYDLADSQSLQTLRNRLAYRCFGLEDPGYQNFYSNPFGPEVAQYGLVDSLRPNRLADCEVPLALLYFTAQDGLQFLDMWSVRRRITAPTAATRWPLFTGERRVSEGEAMFNQFTEHLGDLRVNAAAPTTIRAVDSFRYLPAAGIVPLASPSWTVGFSADQFFDGITTRSALDTRRDNLNGALVRDPLIIESARVGALIRDSFNYPPLDLSSDQRILLWVYRVRENRKTIDRDAGSVPPYLVFASGHMPFVGDAHYDVNRWDYANFS